MLNLPKYHLIIVLYHLILFYFEQQYKEK